jgi:hypothetical protein
MSLETLALRQEITEKVMAARLDIDSVNADIDLETEQIRSIRSELQSRRDKRKTSDCSDGDGRYNHDYVPSLHGCIHVGAVPDVFVI